MSITCKVCDAGEMKPRKIYRMSSPVVIIGYLFLIPSILGMLLGFLFIAATSAAVSQPSEAPKLSAKTEARMHEVGVPDPVIIRIRAGDSSAKAGADALPAEQRSAAMDAAMFLETERAAATVGKGASGAIGIGLGLFLIVASFMGGLLGWLLTMKKRVLQCGACSATVATG